MKGYQYYMQDFKVNVLGSEWSVVFGTEKEYPSLSEMDGYADFSIHQIVIDTMEKTDGQIGFKRDMTAYKKQVIRHEIIHAFLYESGLEACSTTSDNWAVNEEMVDWFAIQSPKIFKVFSELELM
nr:MAG TPA: Protein of unknown function (DUF1570) [Caudoviricetes sp.]